MNSTILIPNSEGQQENNETNSFYMLGEAFAVREIVRAILNESAGINSDSLKTARSRLHQHYSQASSIGWCMPPSIRSLADEEFDAKLAGGWDHLYAPTTECAHKLLPLGIDSLLFSSPDEFQRFLDGYISIFDAMAERFTDEVHEYLLYGLSLNDGQELLNQADAIHIAIGEAQTIDDLADALKLYGKLLETTDHYADDKGVVPWFNSAAIEEDFELYSLKINENRAANIKQFHAEMLTNDRQTVRYLRELEPWHKKKWVLGWHTLGVLEDINASLLGNPDIYAMGNNAPLHPQLADIVEMRGVTSKATSVEKLGVMRAVSKLFADEWNTPFVKQLEKAMQQDGERAKEQDNIHSSQSESVDKVESEEDQVKLYREVPGLMSNIINHLQSTAPCPNLALSFSGALTCMSTLGSRKYQDVSGIRPNTYIISVASSGAGKDHSRKFLKLIPRYIPNIGVVDSVASAEGLEDGLQQTPAMIFLPDEVHTLLRAMSSRKDPRYEGIAKMILTLFSESDSSHNMRIRSGGISGVIHQPALNLHGSAVPKILFETFTEQQIIGGLVPRTIIVDARQPRVAQKASPLEPLPESIQTAFKWFAEFNPGGDLGFINPVPKIVPSTDSAERIYMNLQEESCYIINNASDDDEAIRAIWARICEQARKMALVYAISENYREPEVSESAMRWATTFMRRQTSHTLQMLEQHGGSSDFEQLCRKVLNGVRSNGGKIAHQKLLKRIRIPAKELRSIVSTLEERGDLKYERKATNGREALYYGLP